MAQLKPVGKLDDADQLHDPVCRKTFDDFRFMPTSTMCECGHHPTIHAGNGCALCDLLHLMAEIRRLDR